MAQRRYQVGRSTITLIFGDIRQSSAEVLVSSDDYMITMGGGVSAALRIGAGPAVERDAHKATPREAGDVVLTTAGALRARYIAHAISIGPSHWRDASSPDARARQAAVVRTCTRRTLELLPAVGCRSIAFPSIGTGVAGIPAEVAATEMATSIIEFLLATPQTIDVELYLMDRFGRASEADYFIYFEEFAKSHFTVANSWRGGEQPPGAAHLDLTPVTDLAQQPRIGEAQAILRQLDDRRSSVETQLVAALPTGAPLDSYYTQLADLARLRAMYAAEAADPAPTGRRAESVFVSSTFEDLKPYRHAVRTTIDDLGLTFVGMEEFGAESTAPAEVICRKVRESARYIGILGTRYGYVDPASGLSMTELEYSQAMKSDLPVHIFLLDESVPVPWRVVESDPDKLGKLHAFKDRVMDAHTCSKFTDEADLAQKVRTSLADATAS